MQSKLVYYLSCQAVARTAILISALVVCIKALTSAPTGLALRVEVLALALRFWPWRYHWELMQILSLPRKHRIKIKLSYQGVEQVLRNLSLNVTSSNSLLLMQSTHRYGRPPSTKSTVRMSGRVSCRRGDLHAVTSALYSCSHWSRETHILSCWTVIR